MATAETERAPGHRPGQRVVGGVLDELEDALTPLLGELVVAGHELRLPESGVHPCRIGVRVVAEEGSGLLELGSALLEVARGPQVPTQPLVSERLALRGRPDLERFLRDLDGAFVPGGGTGELGGLPEPVAPVGLSRAVAGVVPELEGPLEMGERGAGGDRRRRVRGGERGDKGAFAVAGPVEVEGELAGPVGPAELRGRLLLEGFGDPAMEPCALRREQVGVDDLADEGVTEPVGVGGGVDHDQLRVHRGARHPARWLRRRGRRSPATGRASCPVPRPPWHRPPGGPGRRVRRCPPRSGPTGRRGSPRPATWAATSSSVKNGFPCPRARICSTSSWGAVVPSSAVTRAVTSSGSRPDRWIRCTVGRRVSSASRRRCDGCAPTSVARYVPISTTGVSRRFRARNSKRSQVLASAQ